MSEPRKEYMDELVGALQHCLREANDPKTKVPPGADPAEWAIRQFLMGWQGPVQSALEMIEDYLGTAKAVCATGDMATAQSDIESAEQLIRDCLRVELDMHEEDDPPPPAD